MATNTVGGKGREFHTQQVHYLRRTINWNTAGVATGASLGFLPAGAQVIQSNVIVKTAWNGSAATLTVGTNSSSYNNIHSGMTQTQTALTVNYVGTAGAVGVTLTQDTEVFVKVVNGATTAPSAGQAICILSYAPNNDQ